MSTILDWNVVQQTAPGESESGDLHLLEPFPGGILAAVIDGIGHGAEAAAAARIAAAAIKSQAQDPLIILIEKCHQVLKGTRGAAISLASFDLSKRTMTWLGVGNVEGILFYHNLRTDVVYRALLLRAGIVGCHLPQLHETVIPVKSGDTLIFATDGISYSFTNDVNLNCSTQQIAGSLLAGYYKGNDDALVLVARFLGGSQ